MKKYKIIIVAFVIFITFFLIYGLFLSDSSFTERALGKMSTCDTFKIVNNNDNNYNNKIYDYKKYTDAIYPREIICIKKFFTNKKYSNLVEKQYSFTGYNINLYNKDSFMGEIKIYSALEKDNKEKILMIYDDKICFYPKNFNELNSIMNIYKE